MRNPCSSSKDWRASRVDFALSALGSKQKEMEEVNRLTAAANVVFDLQTGRQPRHWLWLQAHCSE